MSQRIAELGAEIKRLRNIKPSALVAGFEEVG